MAAGDLWRHKLRTALTVLGVTIAAVILVISLSTGRGVSRAVEEHFRMGGRLRRIIVHPTYGSRSADSTAVPRTIPGEMSVSRRERLRRAIADREPRSDWVPLNSERIAELAALPHVERVVPQVILRAHMVYGEHGAGGVALSASRDDEGLRERIVAGRLFPDDAARSLLVHEYLVYRWGFVDEADVAQVLGRTVRLESQRGRDALTGALAFRLGGDVEFSAAEARVLEEALQRLPRVLDQLDLPPEYVAILKKAFPQPETPGEPPDATAWTEEFTIAGVFRDPTEEEQRNRMDFMGVQADAIVPVQTARRLHDRIPAEAEFGYTSAMVYVDDERHLKETVERIEMMSLRTYALLSVVEHIQKYTALVTGAMALLAGVALLVAALGIANVMFMSVLERTRQIGLLKAVGFRNRHVLLIFLVESGLIGFAGGVLGVLGTWLGSFPGESIVRAILAGEVGREIEGSMFVFPWWLLAGVPVFTTLVTMLAGVYPARRAARLDPLVALRQE